MTREPAGVSERPYAAPTRFVVVVGLGITLWCIGFAAISVWFEATDRFATGTYAAEADALSVMNWVVVVLKVLGAAAALLAIRARPVAPRITGLVLWGAFSTVTVYVLGSLTQAVVILTGIAGDGEGVDARSTAYVLAFLVASVGFGILAVSYARRVRMSRWLIALGVLGAPVVLGGVLVIAPALLRAAGLLSAG